jgi:endonuclease YncB( thermonuclease family)
VTAIPELQEALVDLVLDGASIAVYMPGTEEEVTVELIGVDAPFEDECFGEDSAENLENLAGDTVWLEAPIGSSLSRTEDRAQSRPSFVWIEGADGEWRLLNQLTIAEGNAGVDRRANDSRYEDWFRVTQDIAEDAGRGIWSTCTEVHGAPLPTPTPEPTPTPTPEPGTRENPVPFGEIVDLGNDFTFGIVDTIPDAYGALVAENMFNDPPREGMQFFIATVQIGYTGDDSIETGGGYGYRAVGQSGVSYESGWDCGVVPNEITDTELFTGGVITGNLCWEVRTEDVGSLVMYLGEGSNRIYFSLQKP